MAMTRARRVLLGVLVAVVMASATTLGVAYADGGSAAESTTTAVDGMPNAIEDFSYPGASRIHEETGALLKRGNGRMLMTSCNGNEDIWIMSRTGQQDFCFDITAKPAFLTLEIPKAHGIWTSVDPVKTTVREGDGTTTVINAPANDFTGYGESGASGEPTMLIELRVNG